MAPQAAGWGIEDLVEGGGGIGVPAGFAEIVSARFVRRMILKMSEEPPADYSGDTGLFMAWLGKYQDEAGEMQQTEELLSVGRGFVLGQWDEEAGETVPVDDGVNEGQFVIGPGIKKNSKFGIFLHHLFETAGCTLETGPTIPVGALDGVKFKVVRIPEIDFNTKKPKVNAKGYPVTMAVPAEIVAALPWDEAPKPAPKGKVVGKPAAAPAKALPAKAPAKGAAKPAAAAPAAAESEFDEGLIAQILTNILERNKGSVAKAKIYSEVYKEVDLNFKEHETNKAGLVKAVNAVVVAGGIDGVCSFDPKTAMISAA